MLSLITLLSLGLLLLLCIVKSNHAIGVFIFIEFAFPSSISLLSKSLNVTELAFIIFLIYPIVKNIGNKPDKYPTSLLIVPILYIIAMIIPYYNSVIVDRSPLLQLLVYDFPKFFFPGVFLFYSIRTYDDFIVVTKWIILLVGFWTCFNFYEFASKKNFFIDLLLKEFPTSTTSVNTGYAYNGSTVNERFGSSLRVQATVWHPISYGGRVNLLLCILLLFLSAVKENYISKRFVFKLLIFAAYLAVFCTLIASLLTLSRSVWIFSLLTFGIYIYCNTKYKKAIIALGLVLSLFVLLFLGYEFIKYFDVKGSSASMRLNQFNAVMRLLGSDYIWGRGNSFVNDFIDRYGEYTDALGFESFFFVVILESGLVGVLFYFIFFRNIFLLFKNSAAKPAIYFGFYSTFPYLVYILLTGEMQTIWLYWLVINIGAACLKMMEQSLTISKAVDKFYKFDPKRLQKTN
jgi:hypothetical protein